MDIQNLLKYKEELLKSLNVFLMYSGKQVDFLDTDNLRMYNTLLFAFILNQLIGYFPEMKEPHRYIKVGLARGTVFIPKVNLFLFEHEWIMLENYVIDVTLTLRYLIGTGEKRSDILKLPMEIQEAISPIVFADLNNLDSHQITEFIPKNWFDDRLETPIKMRDGSQKQIYNYLKTFLNDYSID